MKQLKSKCILLRKDIFLSAIFFLTILFSCKDDGELVPEFNSALLNITDTIITVTSNTALADSVRTDRVSRSLFGKLNDQTFGLSSSEFYTQIYMPSEVLNTTALTEDDIDSVVLQLAYDNSYGYISSQEIVVFELEEDLVDSLEYYSTSSVLAPNILGFATITVDPTDTLADSAHVVRISLNIELGKRIVGKEFSSQSEWLEFFRGIRVSPGMTDPTTGDGAIVHFNLLHSRSKMHVYYTVGDSSGVFSFLVESGSQRFAHFDHNQQGSDLLASIDKKDDQVNYLTSMAGSNIKMTFDNLEKISAELGVIAINKAELILPFEDPVITEYDPPSKLVIIIRDDNGDVALPIDWFKGGPDYFGGSLDKTNKEYRFNLASTMHEMLNLGDYDRELFLSVSGSSVTANRIVMNSGVKAIQKREMYVHLTYTKGK